LDEDEEEEDADDLLADDDDDEDDDEEVDLETLMKAAQSEKRKGQGDLKGQPPAKKQNTGAAPSQQQ